MIRQKFWRSNHPDDPWARLLFIAMWNWADDWGVGTCDVRSLLGYAFPNDRNINEDMMEVMLRDIGQSYGVVYYTVSRQPYYAIPSWPLHQKVDHPSKTLRNPGPDQAESWLRREAFAIPDDPREAFARDSRESRREVEVEVEGEGETEGEVDLRSTRTLARRSDSTPAKGSRLPDDFMPRTATVRAIKADLSVTDAWLSYHHEKFCDYWRSVPGAKGRKIDWNATWRNWMKTEVERNGNQLRAGAGALRGADAKAAGWQALKEER